jgi:hypothetical protein
VAGEGRELGAATSLTRGNDVLLIMAAMALMLLALAAVLAVNEQEVERRFE